MSHGNHKTTDSLERNVSTTSDGASQTQTSTEVIGSHHTLIKLEYGVVCGPPAALTALLAEKRSKAKAKTISTYQEMADKGNDYGQLRMGEYYLKGDGVEKDEAKARAFFKASAEQGNIEAADWLKTLDNKKP
jgi:TPR repeat protein